MLVFRFLGVCLVLFSFGILWELMGLWSLAVYPGAVVVGVMIGWSARRV
jgi:hypothetical protein